MIVNNKIYRRTNVLGLDSQWSKVMEMDPRCTIYYTGFTKYFQDDSNQIGNMRFIVYRHYDGNVYVKGFNNNADDKGVRVSDEFNEGCYFMSLSSDGILSNGLNMVDINQSHENTPIKKGSIFNSLSIRLTDPVTEFTTFSLTADSVFYDNNKGSQGAKQSIPCLCDQKQYYVQACSCDSSCDGYKHSCICYSRSY
jgi:hypothetical protein